MTTSKQVSMKGNRNANFGTTQAVGIVGGILGGAAALGNGGSIPGAITGVAVGATVGWAAGSVVSFLNDCGPAPKIIGSAYAGLIGASFGAIASGIVNEMTGSVPGNNEQ